MAIVWRAYNNRARAGIDAVVSGTGSSRTITVKYWAQMDAYASTSGSSTVILSGAITGNLNQTLSLGPGGSKLLGTRSMTVNLTDSVQSFGFGVSFTHYGGGGGLVTTGYNPGLTVQVPARVPSKPGKPSVSRGSDTSHTVSWSKSNTVTSVVVQRKTNDGAWVLVGAPSGNLTSWTDTSTKAGNKYQYRVQVKSAGGSSVWSDASNVVFTTPVKPGKPSAIRVGGDVRVSAAGTGYATSFNVQDDGAAVGSDVGLPFTHSAPNPAVTHRYRVQGRVSSGTSNDQVLTGPFSDYSDTVQLAAPPNAPTGLSPNGSVLVDDVVARFSWQHNPVDSSEQTAYELRYRLVGGAWSTLTGTTDSSRNFLLAAGNYEWQARTKGTHPDWSPWSATASFEVVERPTVAILSPEDPVTDAVITAVWNYSQAQGRPQSSWRVELVQDSVVLEAKSGSGATASTALATHLKADTGYVLRVQVATGGIWSDWSEQPFTTVFEPPAPGIITGLWNEDTGGVDVDVQLPEPASGTVTNYALPIEGSGTWAEVARNHSSNPAAVSGWSNWTYSLTTSASWATGLNVDGVSTAYEAVFASPSSGSRIVNTLRGLAVDVVYSVSLWIKCDEADEYRVRIANANSATGAQVGSSLSAQGLQNGEYGLYEMSLTASAETMYLQVYRTVNGDSPEVLGATKVSVQPANNDYGYFDDNLLPNVSGAEDFRVTLTENNNPVLEIETVANLPELVGGYYSDGQIRVLEEATITIDPGDTVMIAPVGDDQTVNGVPVDGETRATGEMVLSAGWWQHLGFFTGTYSDPFFDGGTGWVQIGGQPMLTKWNVDGTSTAYPPEPIVQAVLERSLDQEAWEPVTESDTDIVLTDFEARSNGSTFYRLTTFSSAGATTETIIEVVADSQKIWVNAGVSLENSFWLEYENAHPAFEGGRNRANFHYSGRKKAVAYAGQAITRVIDFEGWLEPAQSIDDAIEVIQSDGAVMQYRDPNGRRVYGIISGLSGRRETGSGWHSVRGRIEESSR